MCSIAVPIAVSAAPPPATPTATPSAIVVRVVLAVRLREIVDQEAALLGAQLRAVADHPVDNLGPVLAVFVLLVNPLAGVADRAARVDQRLPVEDGGRRRASFSSPACEIFDRSEEHTSELQSRENLVCR